eukprot:3571758-Rhodomonas_salina.3
MYLANSCQENRWSGRAARKTSRSTRQARTSSSWHGAMRANTLAFGAHILLPRCVVLFVCLGALFGLHVVLLLLSGSAFFAAGFHLGRDALLWCGPLRQSETALWLGSQIDLRAIPPRTMPSMAYSGS